MNEQIFPTEVAQQGDMEGEARGGTQGGIQDGGSVLETPSVIAAAPPDSRVENSIEEPAKVMRLGAMLRQLLAEIRSDPLDELSRQRLREIYETSVQELGSALSGDLQEELESLIPPLADDKVPTRDELRVAKAQLVGWLEGLVQGIQAAIFAQQMSAQKQLANMRSQLPPSRTPRTPPNTGTYL